MKYNLLSYFFSLTLWLFASGVILADDFQDYDTNGDGVISKAEFEAHARRAVKAAGAGKATGSAETTAPKEKSGLIGLLERDFEIRKSFFTDKDSLDPAKLSWTKAEHADAFYQLDAAILWKPAFLSSGTTIGDDSIAWFVQPSFESHISTKTGSAQDQLTYRTPLTLEYYPGGLDIQKAMDNPNAAVPPARFITVHTLTISPTYQTDRDAKTRSIEAEIAYTPTIPSLAVGVRQRLFGWDSAHLLWRPYIGGEFGDYLDRNTTTGVSMDRGISRFVARAEAEMLLGNRFAATGSFVHRTEFNGDSRSLDYGEISAMLILDATVPSDPKEKPHFTAGVTYKRGKDAPDFVDADVVTAWLGVRF